MATPQRAQGHTGLIRQFLFFWHLGTLALRTWPNPPKYVVAPDCPNVKKIKNGGLHQYGPKRFGRLIFATIRKMWEWKGKIPRYFVVNDQARITDINKKASNWVVNREKTTRWMNIVHLQQRCSRLNLINVYARVIATEMSLPAGQVWKLSPSTTSFSNNRELGVMFIVRLCIRTGLRVSETFKICICVNWNGGIFLNLAKFGTAA